MFDQGDFLNEFDDQQLGEQIKLPYLFEPRDYQLPLFQHMVPEAFPTSELNEHVKNAVCVWHRRAGKDKCSINIMVCRAMIDVPGYYLYMAPEAAQARKIIWEGIGSDGMRFIDHIPPELVKSIRNQDMRIELTNGSVIQVAGSDNYDSLVGTNPKGIIFSEYSLQNPAALQYFRPMLVENGGWSVFIYTPRGHNHGFELHKTAKKRTQAGHPDWFHQLVTIDDSHREDGSPVVTREQYEQEIEDGVPEATALQEYYVDFDQGNVGAYYADQLAKLYKQQAIGYFPHDPSRQVITAWDLGLNDNNSIWFFQVGPAGPRLIDFESEANVSMTEWIRRVREKPYDYHEHIAPHDIGDREKFTAKTLKQQCEDIGFFFTTAPKGTVRDGIEMVRSLLPVCQFNELECAEGIEALHAYERVYDEQLKNFKDTPRHNWASHPADAFRYLASMWYRYKDIGNEVPSHYVITSAGTKHKKGSGGGLPPLVMGGVTRRNGKQWSR